MEHLIDLVENELLKHTRLESPDPHDPIEVSNIPYGWHLIGKGNYAGVFYHKDFPDLAVKVYAEGRKGIEDEKEVYKRLGKHPSYSHCFHYGSNYLILKRLKGITFYDCMKKGIYIPKEVVKDIDEALSYAKRIGLHPHDIHFKNVAMDNGKGIIVDVSDFLKEEYCPLWHDCKKFYYKFYKQLPIIVPIPDFALNTGRKLYRLYKKYKRKKQNISKSLYKLQ